jgi:UDP-N-acetylmuramate--alanine ligase
MELKACIHSIRALYPDRYVIGVFQPHLFSRTQDFADDFAAVLSKLDEVALLPIYPAREKPIEGITSEWLMEKVTTKRALVSPTILAKFLRERTKQTLETGMNCVVVTMGAGDIDRQVNDIAKALQL